MSGRSETTRFVAREIRSFNISEGMCFQLMNEHWNRAGKCVPPWSDDELRREVAAAYRQAEAQEDGETVSLAGDPVRVLPRERRPLGFGTVELDEPEADRRFFARHPFRTHYVRRAFDFEVQCYNDNGLRPPPSGIPGRPALFIVVERVALGQHMRSPFWGASHIDTDVSNAEARAISDRIAPPGGEAFRATLRASMREGDQ